MLQTLIFVIGTSIQIQQNKKLNFLKFTLGLTTHVALISYNAKRFEWKISHVSPTRGCVFAPTIFKFKFISFEGYNL
jgi:hypothetical protein